MKYVFLFGCCCFCLCVGSLVGCQFARETGGVIKGLFVSPNGPAPIEAISEGLNLFIPGATAVGGLLVAFAGLFIKKKVQVRGEKKMAEAVAKAMTPAPMINTQTP